ncbi:MAG: S9 family peptidase [Verrucomicrobiae bacterium]|nr:S9 family peptidase [Verrucomicrobiae bacterium]
MKSSPRPDYPSTATTNVVEDYHGVSVADPYRWLEDENAPGTRAWIEAENAVTFAFLEALPRREALRQRLTQLYQYDRFGVPRKSGGRYFYTRNRGLENQPTLLTTTALDAEPSVLLDPNQLSAEGTIALKSYTPNDQGTLVVCALSVAGSDWEEWRVRDVATAQDTGDVLQWVKFSGCAWNREGSGFFYSRFDAPAESGVLSQINEYQKLFFHRVGTPQSEDRLVYERRDHPKWGFGGETTEDGRYLVISVSEGTDTRNRVFYQELGRDDAPVVELLNDFDASYQFIGNEGSRFYFLTDLDAPRSRILAVDLGRPERSQWQEVVPESDATLVSAGLVGGRFVTVYLRNAYSEVKLFALDGRFERSLALPGIGSVSGFSGRQDATETFFSYTSFNTPSSIHRYDFATAETSLWKEPKVDFSPADYETRQVWITSRDGTRVPMFITGRRDLDTTRPHPALLYGYGGFNISITPSFSPANLLWMELGGWYCVPNLRGGGEFGESWHQAGTKLQKQNVFDDFIAAAEWLTAQGWTTPHQLAIAGGSNGGLLVGAAMTQRPELFGAALPAVGVMDMLRFHLFTIGWAWVSDFGSSANAEEFRALLAYSPYHNLRPGTCYPATLVTTADHDDRVVPAHSFKFAARLQAVQACDRPVLIRIETRAGHGAGKPTSKIIEEGSDRIAFIAHELGVPGH